ncbi:LemA family protein [Spirochaeta thermophila DSM 6578]|uniref:LemA family protein n=1 Tax=Winmispira thermophila (strain ATCC 700085 / DSM 6578 / Z-1203) TaxID=869211 RepID=G0GAC6_WINT7|nr:LemA family protein [Spirochaeta thermophila]AEJ61745.1 LemA family protein [Spirochaeta thermophila DSM 6578]
MKPGTRTLLIVAGIILLIVLSLYGCVVGTYNNLVQLEEGVKAQWAQVENVYQRRADLIPNLVATVKGYASHERETLEAVVQARSKVGSLTLDSSVIEDTQKFEAFQQAQAELSSTLSRLLVVVERYPELKANENFLALQAQLEGTENRIAVERRRYNEVAQRFNTAIRRFPAVIIANMFGFKEKAYFKAEAGAEKAPVVNFD